jgi:hypothetical protein
MELSHSRLVVGTLAALLAAGCATVFGMEEGEPLTTTGTSSGTGGTGGTGGTTTTTNGGAGGTTECVVTECPGEDYDCHYRACVNGQCSFLFAAAGTACDDDGGFYCTGAGHCYECLTHEQCATNVCQNNSCVNASCDDQLQNSGETDVDCGGPCGPCPNGKLCALPSDCESGVCVSGTCVPCTDHPQCPTADYYCDLGGSHVCLPKKPLGAVCVNHYECKLNKCVWQPIFGFTCMPL